MEANQNLNREKVMASDSVHNLTKDVLRLSESKDIVDRYYDVGLALKVLKSEMDSALSKNRLIKTATRLKSEFDKRHGVPE